MVLLMKNILALILSVIFQQAAFAQLVKIAPVFIHGNGVGESSFSDEFHYLERTTALKIISKKFEKAGYTTQLGPILLDGFTTKENTFLYSQMDDPFVEIAHPFFFDFFIPELGVAIKYIGLDNCRSVGYGEEIGIDYGKWDLIGAIQTLRETLDAKSPVPTVFFYDPLPIDKDHGDQPSIVELHAQINDFLLWVKSETDAGYLPYKYSKEQFAVSEDRRQEVRALAQDRNQKTNIRLAAIEWLGAAQDRAAISILRGGLEDKEYRINRAAIKSLDQVGSKEAETALVQVITDERFRRNEIYDALYAINPLWTKSEEAKEMLHKWNSDGFTFYRDFNAALQIDSELALKKGRESFRTGQMDSDARNTYLQYCTPKDLPLILDFLSHAMYIDDETEIILARIIPNWRKNPLTRDAVNKQLDNYQFLIKKHDGSEMFLKIYRLNYMEPQWRNSPRIRNQVRSIIEQIHKEAKSSYIKHQFVDSIMIMNIEEANLLLSQWWMQHDDDMSFIEAFVRSCVVFKNSKCSAIIKQNIKWNDEDTEDIRNEVLMAFRKIGGADTYPWIVKGLSDVSVEVRQGAAMAAGERKIAGAVPALIKILKTADDDELIIYAMRALSQIGNQKSIGPLVQALKKWPDNAEITSQIIEALSVWNTSAVESAMMQFLKTAEPSMKESAESDKNKYYLSDTQPNAGVEGAIRWTIKHHRKAIGKYIKPFTACSSPRHRALAQSAEYYFEFRY
jgi:HEAT repeat protein